MARVARFQVYMDERGGWRWRLRSTNGRTIADSSEAYGTKATAVAAVERVRVAATSGVMEA